MCKIVQPVMEAFLIGFPFHLPLLPWLQSQRILLFEFHYLIMILDEVNERLLKPQKYSVGLKK